MRYYKVEIDGGPTFESAPGGVNDPNALRVALSIEKVSIAVSGLNSYVRVYGVTLDQLKAAANYSMKSINISGGFWSPSLPLANLQSTYKKLLHQGTIYAGFGNWRGTDLSLDLLIMPGQGAVAAQSQSSSPGPSAGGVGGGGGGGGFRSGALLHRPKPYFSPSPAPQDDGGLGGDIGSIVSGLGGDLGSILQTLSGILGGGGFGQIPANLIHNLLPGMPLSSAVQQTLTNAFQGVQTELRLGASLLLNYQDSGFYQNLSQYASYLKQLGMSLLKNNVGIDTFIDGNKVTVTDYSIPGPNVTLNYYDLIGQPTWTGLQQVQFSSVMRGDLTGGVTVTMPNTVASIQPGPQYGTNPPTPLTFNGQTLYIWKVRHVGDSRSPDGQQWRTDCWCYTNSVGQQGAIQTGLSAAASALQSIIPSPSSNLLNRRVRIF